MVLIIRHVPQNQNNPSPQEEQQSIFNHNSLDNCVQSILYLSQVHGRHADSSGNALVTRLTGAASRRAPPISEQELDDLLAASRSSALDPFATAVDQSLETRSGEEWNSTDTFSSRSDQRPLDFEFRNLMSADDEIAGVAIADVNDSDDDAYGRFTVGLILAVSSCIFIGASFVIKKLALQRLSRCAGSTRASSGGYGYLRDWLWWSGFLSMGLGEVMNFAAYGFAPASLVTPLGALSVLISALLAARFLRESLNLLGKMGCFLCIVGSVMIVIHAPREADVDSLVELKAALLSGRFILYVISVVGVASLIVIRYVPRYGKTNVLCYILICSLIGSLSVMACKGLSLSLRDAFSSASPRSAGLAVGIGTIVFSGLFWFFLLTLVICITVQMNYLNKALDIFDTSLVTPIYYVFFTSFVLLASMILFREWVGMSAKDVLGSLCGFMTVIAAIFLLNAFRNVSLTMDSLRVHWTATGNSNTKPGHGPNGATAKTQYQKILSIPAGNDMPHSSLVINSDDEDLPDENPPREIRTYFNA